MRTLFVAAASALLFGALVTELSTRLWPGNYVALLVTSVLALFVSGLLNLRLAQRKAQPAVAVPETGYEVTRPRGAAREPGRPRDERPRPSEERARPVEERARVPRQDTAATPRRDTRPAAPRTPAPRPAAEAPPSGPREQGTVKWFNRTKGFGFVIRESGDEIFVHQRSIRPTGEGEERRRPALQDGQMVSFVVAVREKGPQAEDVVPVEPR